LVVDAGQSDSGAFRLVINMNSSAAASTRSKVPRANILGVGVSAINLPLAVGLILDAVQANRKGYVAVTGVHGVSEAQTDIEFRRILNRAFLNTPDGMPMSWVGRLQGFREMNRVYGPDLLLEMAASSTPGNIRHFFYGGGSGVAQSLKANLESQFPGIIVCGTYTPPFRALNVNEASELVRQMSECRPDICWVGLSTPNQERFMAEYLTKLPVKIMIGVGAAFDMHSGKLKQAPYWMQRGGLEWFFRLTQEPKRLWKRYLVNNPLFILRIVAQFTKIRNYPLTD
jgi:N-acetylglucosaminyldiphosphoundecaprenol N-acetyl-beta-D-mannosaminyltransferase